MREDAAALAYLAWRQIVNVVREARKKPARIVLWVFVGLSFAFSLAARVLAARYGIHRQIGIVEPWASALFFGFLALFGYNAIVAANGNVPGFSCECDARFLTLAKIAPRRMLAWLQIRSAFGLLVKIGVLLIVYPMVFPSVGSPMAIALTMIGGALCIGGVRIPVLRAALRFGRTPLLVIGSLIAGIGVLGAAAVVSASIAPLFASEAAFVTHLGFGTFVRSALIGEAGPLLALWTFAIAILVSGYYGSLDIIPEIYAASLRAIATAQRNRRGHAFRTDDRRYGANAAAARARTSLTSRGGGAATLIWKDGLAFSRSSGVLARSVGFLAGGLIIGSAAGLWSGRGHDPSIVAAQALVGVVIYLSLNSSIALAADLGKPIWWLSADSLARRLTAWVIANTWRTAALLVCVALGFAAVRHDVVFAIVSIPVVTALIAYLRCIGLALYAMFPSQLDQKGAVAMVRMLVAMLMLVPVLVAALAVGFPFGTPAGAIAGLAVAAVESAALVGFAARQIRQNGAGFARAEAA